MVVMIRYKLKEGQVEQNRAMLLAVYTELAKNRPQGLRYETFEFDDGVEHISLVEFDGAPGTAPHHQLASFQNYRSTLEARCEEPPTVTLLREIGSYVSG